MSSLFNYKGYWGTCETSIEDGILHGKIECIADLVTYEAETITELKQVFEEAVDDYLETCKELNKTPEKPLSGAFNIRVGSDLHKALYIESLKNKMTLNELVRTMLSNSLRASSFK